MTSDESKLHSFGPAEAIWRGVRVLLVGGRYSADSMEAHVLEALQYLGCATAYVSNTMWFDAIGPTGNALLYKLTHSLFREPERLTESRLIERAVQFSPQVIVVLQGNYLSPKTIALLRKRLETVIVCWCQDHVGTLGRQYMLGADYDAVFLKDRYMQKLFSSMINTTPFYYLPEACNPRIHRPLDLSLEDRRILGCEVMIYGTLYYYRQAILRQLSEFDLKIWGTAPAWFVRRVSPAQAGGDIVLDGKVRAVRAAKIAINPLHYGEIDALNCRAFELAGCGAFQLISHKPVLSEHFTPGVELDSYRSADELVDQIRHYLRNPDQAMELARRGQLRAHAEHTYEHRLRELLTTVLSKSIALQADETSAVNVRRALPV